MSPIKATPTCALVATIIEFPYKPATFLEAPVIQRGSGYELVVGDGLAKGTLAAVQDPVPPSLLGTIRSHVESILQARQLLIHEQFELPEHPRTVQLRSDGKSNITIQAGSAALLIKANPADIVVMDSDGNVVQDTRAERISEHQQFIAAISGAAAQDPLLRQLLRSYQGAVNDPGDEMVHLYEIRDALKQHYGSEAVARQRLQITKKQWQELGEMANDRPVDQSRHRGEHIAGRRPATAAELDVARKAARRLIEAFAKTV